MKVKKSKAFNVLEGHPETITEAINALEEFLIVELDDINLEYKDNPNVMLIINHFKIFKKQIKKIIGDLV